jgi:DnaA family protein
MNMRQMVLGLSEGAPPTFDNFVPGRNAAALAALAALGTPAAADRCLYLWGEPGSGRSHLLTAWRTRHAGAGHCHAIDDVERLDAAAQIALFNLYNRARAGDAWLLVAGPCAPAQLTLRDDVKSRLSWGLSFEILPLTDDEKRAALSNRAREHGMPMTPEMLDYLLSRARRDMPSLIALIDALDMFSLETKRPLTLPLVRELLNQNQTLPL